jgi:S-adenosylmethionine/arginine decarboxylase-like enzyme
LKDLAPSIYRQRLCIEGLYTKEITARLLKQFMIDLSTRLGMTIIFGPHVMRLAEHIEPKHKGFECVMIWAESGVQMYTWEIENFLTLDVYSCKPFVNETVVDMVKFYFDSYKLQWKIV